MSGSQLGAGAVPLGIAITPDAHTAYVVDAGGSSVTPIDLTTDPMRSGTAITFPSAPHPRGLNFIAISPDGKKAYVSDPANDQVVPLDLTTTPAKPGTPISIGPNPEGIAFTPDGSMAYVADNANTASGPGVTPITVATNTAGAKITGFGPHPFSIAITPDGSHAYVGDAGGGSDNKIYPIDLPAATHGNAIQAAGGNLGIAILPNGSRAYAANGTSVTPISLPSDSPGQPIAMPGGAFAIAATPDSQKVYVTNDGGAGGGGTTVTPIATAANTPGATIAVGTTPRGIAITPDQAPVANFAVTSAPPGSPTAFDASASTVQFGSITSYMWNFGDGSPIVTTPSPRTSHTYITAGQFTASVTETDTAGTSVSGEIFTGQTASSVGSASAETSRSVVITTAPAPAVTLSASSLSFAAQPVGSTSAGQTITITNSGDAPLAIPSSLISGSQAAEFALTADSCTGTSVAAGASCSAQVVFRPTVASGASAQLAFTDNASGSPHTISLGGIGTEPRVSLSAVSLTFAAQQPGTPSAPQPVTITDMGTAPLLMVSAKIGGPQAGDFSLSSDGCSGRSLAPGGSCTDEVTFKPSGLGTRAAQLALTDNASGSPHAVSLTGVGTSFGSLAGLVRSLVAPATNPAPLPGATVLVCHPNFVGCFTMPDQADGTYRTGQLIPGPYHVEVYPPDGSPLLSFATNAIVNAGAPTTVSTVLRLPRPFKRGITVRTGAGTKGKLPVVYLNSPASFLFETSQLPGAEFGPPAPCFLSLETVTLSGSTAPGVNGGKSYQFSATQKIALDYPGPGALTFSTPQNGNLLNPGAAGKPATIVITQRVGRAVVTWALVAGSGRGGENVYAGLLITLSGMQDVFGPHGADLHGNISIDVHGSNAWECKINGGGSGDTGGDILIDPSGFVHTATGGLPVPGAQVTLRRGNAHGVFTAPLTGENSIFSPAVNPERTDALGHYGWNVVPGRYKVSVRRRGCNPKTSRVVTVPPPVTTLTVKLRCPHLTRVRTTATGHVVGNTRSGSGTVLVVTLKTPRRAAIAGYITVRTGHHSYTTPVAGTKTMIGIPGVRTGRHRVAIFYSGDGYRQPARGHLVLVVRR